MDKPQSPTIIDEAGSDGRLARISWRDSEDEPWACVSEFALKPAGELRAVISAAIHAGRTKHSFYKLDAGKLLPQAAAIHARAQREDMSMSKTAKRVSELVAKMHKPTKEEKAAARAAVKADKAKAKAESKAAAAKAKAEKKAAKPAKAAKQRAKRAKFTDSDLTLIIAVIQDVLKGSGKPVKRNVFVNAIMKRSPKFKDLDLDLRMPMQKLEEQGLVIITKPKGANFKTYALNPHPPKEKAPKPNGKAPEKAAAVVVAETPAPKRIRKH